MYKNKDYIFYHVQHRILQDLQFILDSNIQTKETITSSRYITNIAYLKLPGHTKHPPLCSLNNYKKSRQKCLVETKRGETRSHFSYNMYKVLGTLIDFKAIIFHGVC